MSLAGSTTLPPIVAVVGATATGKSGLGVALARALDGEVINADSMQLYRGMDIGTAKLTLDERHGVPHHLLDIWEVRRSADVATYQQQARAVVDDLRARGRTPVVVGGSGLYVRALLDDLDFPGTDPDVRAALESELASTGPGPLYERLRLSDPDAAAAIEPRNGRRIVRALEVVSLRGSFTARLPEPRALMANTVTIGLDIPRDELDQRIADRVAPDVGGRARGRGPAARRRGGSARRTYGVPSPRLCADRCACSTVSSPRSRRSTTPCARPVGSPDARTAGSAGTTGSIGSPTIPTTSSRRRWP